MKKRKLPKGQTHHGHGSLIARTSFGASEVRFDKNGKLLDTFVTMKNVKGRKKIKK